MGIEGASLDAAILSPILWLVVVVELRTLPQPFLPQGSQGSPGCEGDSGYCVSFLEQQIKVLETEWSFLQETVKSPTLRPTVGI